MNFENLRLKYPMLLTHMELSGYSKRYIMRFRREIEQILKNAETMKWSNYSDIHQHYETNLLNSHALRQKQTLLRAIEQFDTNGSFPDGTTKGILSKNSYDKLNHKFKGLIDKYRMVAEGNRIKASSIYRISGEASAFFLSIQEHGLSRLEDVTEEAVLSAFVSPSGEHLRGYNCRKAVSAVLNACISMEPDACLKALAFLPTIKYSRNNIQYLTEYESKKIREALDDTTNLLSLRNRAIGMLVMFTGIRCSDIAKMNLTSIDFERESITIPNQEKTMVPHELPLNAVVGNTIYDYLATERPPVDSPALFISQNAPFRRLKAVSIGCVSKSIMKAAGIRQSKGDRKGLHIFRHRVATTLIGNNISLAVTSRYLGQLHPSSCEDYLSADFINLKTCALSISRFPVSKEVFGVG